MHCDQDKHEEKKNALIVRGEDASLQFDLKLDPECSQEFPLTGCTGVSGQFAAADGVNWITVVGFVVSEDVGIAQVNIIGSVTSTMLLGARQQVQLLLTFGSALRKVQFMNALDVVDDLTANPPPACPTHPSPWD